jgi:DNA-directed RNA polymerase specialized sigma24 family protein
MSPGEPAVCHLSPAEISAAISELSETDNIRLRKVAHAYSRDRPIDAEDLLQDAFVCVLDCSRKCPRNVVRFLAEAMRSIACDALKAQVRRPVLCPVPESGEDELPFDPPDPKPNTEQELAAAEEARRIKRAILDLFSDDLEAQTIAEGTMDGMEGEELRSCTGLDEKAFASKRRLVRRRIEKAFPKGRKP